MTHTALKAVDRLKRDGIPVGVIDMFMLKPVDENLLSKTLSKYECVITVEEAFINKGGLDSLIAGVLENKGLEIKLKRIGFKDAYVFDIGGRDFLHRLNGLDEDSIIKIVKDTIKGI